MWRVSHAEHVPLLIAYEVIPRLVCRRRSGRHRRFQVGADDPAAPASYAARFIAAGDFSTQPYPVMERAGDAARQPGGAAPLPAIVASARSAMLWRCTRSARHPLRREAGVNERVPALPYAAAAITTSRALSTTRGCPDLLAEQFHLPAGNWLYIAPEQVLARAQRSAQRPVLPPGVTPAPPSLPASAPFGNPEPAWPGLSAPAPVPRPAAAAARSVSPEPLRAGCRRMSQRCPAKMDADALRQRARRSLAFDPAAASGAGELSPRAERTARDGLNVRAGGAGLAPSGYEPPSTASRPIAQHLGTHRWRPLTWIHGEEALVVRR